MTISGMFNADYFLHVQEHLLISAVSVALACAVGIPLGILASGNKALKKALSGIFSTLRVIPSIAVLLLCLPIMGTGFFTAVAALTVLAIPPVFINTALAFGSIPEAVLETAMAMGMSRLRTFFLVRVPLSLPFMIAGIKTATVEVLASATLAAYIGAGGLGAIIFTGLGLLRTDLLLIGGISVAALSIAADILLSCLETQVVRYKNR
ncbi:MAG: ABC transporter permease [Spirochaetaceae bacterium]|jgi:osmoprotectant transport system permease protein|nr:ABC transporter permease [Spirochaetaceae bacterium]